MLLLKETIKYCKMLIENGADVNIKNSFGNTPLHIACASYDPRRDHSPKFEEFFLNTGAEIDSLNNELETPLMMLFFDQGQDDRNSANNSKYDPITALVILLKFKADVNIVSKSKKTALHYAWSKGSSISALSLIQNGADWNAKDYTETTPYGYAMKNNHEDLCIFLIQQGKLIDLPINSAVPNPDHKLNQIEILERYVNSPEVDELLNQK